jgi:hypothetical protein
MYLLRLHPNIENAEMMVVPDLSREVQFVFDERRRACAAEAAAAARIQRAFRRHLWRRRVLFNPKTACGKFFARLMDAVRVRRDAQHARIVAAEADLAPAPCASTRQSSSSSSSSSFSW